jgi:hypothetical protein
MAPTFLNPADTAVEIWITLFFSDREPLGPCTVRIEAERALTVRFGDLAAPEPIPRDRLFVATAASMHPILVVGGFPLDAARDTSTEWPADTSPPRSITARRS